MVRLGSLVGGAAGVQEALAVASRAEGGVAVAEHDEVAGGEPAGESGLAPRAGPAVVDHADPHAGQLDLAPLGQVETDVVVAEDGVDGRHLGQIVEEPALEHVAGVEDDVGRAEVVDRRGRQHLGPAAADVGVGQHDHPHRWSPGADGSCTSTVGAMGSSVVGRAGAGGSGGGSAAAAGDGAGPARRDVVPERCSDRSSTP